MTATPNVGDVPNKHALLRWSKPPDAECRFPPYPVIEGQW